MQDIPILIIRELCITTSLCFSRLGGIFRNGDGARALSRSIEKCGSLKKLQYVTLTYSQDM